MHTAIVHCKVKNLTIYFYNLTILWSSSLFQSTVVALHSIIILIFAHLSVVYSCILFIWLSIYKRGRMCNVCMCWDKSLEQKKYYKNRDSMVRKEMTDSPSARISCTCNIIEILGLDNVVFWLSIWYTKMIIIIIRMNLYFNYELLLGFLFCCSVMVWF